MGYVLSLCKCSTTFQLFFVTIIVIDGRNRNIQSKPVGL